MARGSANNVTENKTRPRRGTPTKEIEDSKGTHSNDKKTTTTKRNSIPITKVEKKGNKKTDKLASSNIDKTSSGSSKGLDTDAASDQSVKKDTSKKNPANKTPKLIEKVERKRKAGNTNVKSVEEIVEKKIARVQNKKNTFDPVDESSEDSKKVTGVASRKTRNAKKAEDKDLEKNDADAVEIEEKMDISENKDQIETFDDSSQSSTNIKSGTVRKTRSTKNVEVTVPVELKTEKAEDKLDKKSLKVDTTDDSSQDSLKPNKVGSTRKTRNTKKSEANLIVEQKDSKSVEEKDEVNLIENVQKNLVDENSSDLVKLSKSGSVRKTRSANKVEDFKTLNVDEDKHSEIKDALEMDKKETFDAVDDSSRDSISFPKTTRKTRNLKKLEETIVEQKEAKGKIGCTESDLQGSTVDDNSQDSAAHIKSGLTRKTRGAKKSKQIEQTKGDEAKQDPLGNDAKSDASEENSQDSTKSIDNEPTRKTRNSKKVEENKECSDISDKDVVLQLSLKADPTVCSVEDSMKLSQSGLFEKTSNEKNAEEIIISKEGIAPLDEVQSCIADEISQDPDLKSIEKNLTERTKNKTDLKEKDSKTDEIEKVDHSEKTVGSDITNDDHQDLLETMKEDSGCKAQNVEKFDGNRTENRFDHKDEVVESDIVVEKGEVLSKLIELDSTRNVEHIEENPLGKPKERVLEQKVCKVIEGNIEKLEEYKVDSKISVQEENKNIEVEEGMDCSELDKLEEHRDKSEALKQSEDMEENNIQTQKEDEGEINSSNKINPSIDSCYSINNQITKTCFESDDSKCSASDKNLIDNTSQAKDSALKNSIQTEFEGTETELFKNTEGNLQSDNKNLHEFDVEDNQNECLTENDVLNSRPISANQENIESDSQTDTSRNAIHSEIESTVLEDAEREEIKYSSLNEKEKTIKKLITSEMGLEKEANSDKRKAIAHEQLASFSVTNSESEINSSAGQSNFEIRNVNCGEIQELKESETTANIGEETKIIDESSECTSEEACLVINKGQCKDGEVQKLTESDVLGKSCNDSISDEKSSKCTAEIGVKDSKVCDDKVNEISEVSSSKEITLEAMSSDCNQKGMRSGMVSETSENVKINIEKCLSRTEEASIKNVNLKSSFIGVSDTGEEKSVLPEVDSAKNSCFMVENTEKVSGSQYSIQDSSDVGDQDCTASEILFDSEETTIDMEDCSNLTEEASITDANLDSPTTDMVDSGTENSTILEIDSIGNASTLNEQIKNLSRIQHSINDSSDGVDSKNQEDTTCKKIDDFEETKNKTEAISFQNVDLESLAIDATENGQEHSTMHEMNSVGGTSVKAKIVEGIAETHDQIKGYSKTNIRDQDDTTIDCNESTRSIEKCKDKTEEMSVKIVKSKSHVKDMTDSETENSAIPNIDSVNSTNISSGDIVDDNVNKSSISKETHSLLEGQDKISELSGDTAISNAVETIENISTNSSINKTFSEPKTNTSFISNEKISEGKLDIETNASKIPEDFDSRSNDDGCHTSFEDQLKDSDNVQKPHETFKETDIRTETSEASNLNQIEQSSDFSPEIKIAPDCSPEVDNYEMGLKPKSIKKKKASKSIKKGGKSNKDGGVKQFETDEVGKKIITTYEVTSSVDSSKKGIKRNVSDCSDTTGTEVSLALKIKRKRIDGVESHSVSPSTKNINPPGTSKSIEDHIRTQNQQSSADSSLEPGPSGFKPESKRLSRKRKRTDETTAIIPENSAAPVRMYLERFVPFLLEGLLKITYVRPDDPIQYLADWMKDNKEAAYSSMNQMQSSD